MKIYLKVAIFVLTFLFIRFNLESQIKWNKTNLSADSVFCIINVGTNLFAGTNSGIYLSEDNCSTWVSKSSGLPNDNITSLALSNSFLFAGTANNGVYQSSDNGSSWISINQSLTNLNIKCLIPFKNDIYACSKAKIFKYSFENKSWDSYYTQIVNCFCITGDTIDVGAVSGLWQTCDNFVSLGKYLFNVTDVISVIRYKSNIYFGTESSGFYHYIPDHPCDISTVKGLPNDPITSLIVIDTFIVAGTRGGGIFVSNDNGFNWQTVNTGLTNLSINNLSIMGNMIYACTNGGGVFTSKIVVIDGVKDNQDNEFLVYPNPSSGLINITFKNNSINKINVSLYDLKGNTIFEKNESMEISNSDYLYDISSLSSGLYILKITNNGFNYPSQILMLNK